MSNEYEIASDSRADLIYTKEQLLAPLLPGMEEPPHPMRLGENEADYYVDALAHPGVSVGAEYPVASASRGLSPSPEAPKSPTGKHAEEADQ